MYAAAGRRRRRAGRLPRRARRRRHSRAARRRSAGAARRSPRTRRPRATPGRVAAARAGAARRGSRTRSRARPCVAACPTRGRSRGSGRTRARRSAPPTRRPEARGSRGASAARADDTKSTQRECREVRARPVHEPHDGAVAEPVDHADPAVADVEREDPFARKAESLRETRTHDAAVRDDRGDVALVLGADVGERGARARAKVVEALAAGEAHACRLLHPAAIQLRALERDLVEGATLELAEVELAKTLVDERVAERGRGLARAAARARVDDVAGEPGQPPGVRPPAVGQADVEPPIAAAARVVFRLCVPDEQDPGHPATRRAASAAACASSVVAPSVSPVTPPSHRRKNAPSTSATAAAVPIAASPETPRTPSATAPATRSPRSTPFQEVRSTGSPGRAYVRNAACGSAAQRPHAAAAANALQALPSAESADASNRSTTTSVTAPNEPIAWSRMISSRRSRVMPPSASAVSASASKCIAPVSSAASASPSMAAANAGSGPRARSIRPPATTPTPPPTSGKSGAARATAARSNAASRPVGTRVRNAVAAARSSATRIGHLRALERRHLVQHRERRSQQRKGERRAAPLAEPQTEVEQRSEAERLQAEAVARLRREMSRDHVLDRARLDPRSDERGGRDDEPVEHHGETLLCGAQCDACEERDLEPAERGEHVDRVVAERRVDSKRALDDVDLVPYALGVESGSRPADRRGGHTEQRGVQRARGLGVRDAHVPARNHAAAATELSRQLDASLDGLNSLFAAHRGTPRCVRRPRTHAGVDDDDLGAGDRKSTRLN